MAVDPVSGILADTVLACYQEYQHRFRDITRKAPLRFMRRQWAAIREDTTVRVNLYSAAVDQAQQTILGRLQDRAASTGFWAEAKAIYAGRTDTWHDRELAWTFFNSVTRRIFDTIGINQAIEFLHLDAASALPHATEAVYRTYPLSESPTAVIRRLIGDFAELSISPEGLDAVLPEIARRVEKRLPENGHKSRQVQARIDMLRAVFYRGQGAYLIGRIVSPAGTSPMVLALMHPAEGLTIDALLLDTDAVSVVLSYTRSAFHVMVDRPGEIVAFLKSILPAKPDVDLFSAIGHFKHGKTVLYRDVCRHTAECSDDRFRISPGKLGMVMLVFDMPGLDMVIKLIRDRFDNPKKTTRQLVMQQYDFVFKHYRVGRLIEAHAFEHLCFDRCWFSDDLLAHLLSEAKRTVRLAGEQVIIDHAYIERRVVPLDIFLKTAPPAAAQAAVIDFGRAIKDLAVANIFPGDMLLKNFGVTRHGRVVFYDYDEIVTLTDCRFRRIPRPRTYMEEMADEPWYTVEENDVFPEELSRFLGLSPEHTKRFLHHHEDLLTVDFWTKVQSEIENGVIRHIHPYGPKARLA